MEIIISIDLALWSGPVDFLEEIFFHQHCDREVDITQLTLTTALTFFSDNPSLKCGLGTEQGSARPINVYDKREKGNEDESEISPNVCNHEGDIDYEIW